jgi:hypothetical protein
LTSGEGPEGSTGNKKPTVGLVTEVGCLRFDLSFAYRASPHNGALLQQQQMQAPTLLLGLTGHLLSYSGSRESQFAGCNVKIDLHGTDRMGAKFSQSTSGIKTLFANVLDPFLDKKHGSVAPVPVDGTYTNAHFCLDLNPIKK